MLGRPALGARRWTSSQSGTPGSLTSLFTRGTNSTHTLVLVDGVRMNSPYFPGYDFSALTTENIERIEIVRGPVLGALRLGRDRRRRPDLHADAPPQGVSGRATGEAGNQGQRQGSAFVSAGEGPFSGDGELPLRRVRRRPPQHRLAAAQRLGRVWRRGFPEASRIARRRVRSSTARSATRARSAPRAPRADFFREERLAIPGSFPLSGANHLDVLLAGVRSKPGYRDTAGGFSSQTDAETLQARVADTARSARTR